MFVRISQFGRFVPWLPRRFFPSLSVRARIAALAAIPVVGFIANGVNYFVSEREVSRAFEAVSRSSALTDASGDLKAALHAIRYVAKETAYNPGNNVVKAFENNLTAAKKSLESIQQNGDAADTRTVPHIVRTVAGLKENYTNLVKAQEVVGFDEKQGLNGKLREAAVAVEQIIRDLSWLAETDAAKLSLSLLSMRRHEADYKARREKASRKDYFAEVDAFHKGFDEGIGADIMKAELRDAVKAYAGVFREYVSQRNEVDSQLTLIEQDTHEMGPLADRIGAAAKRSEGKATAQLAASQQQTKMLVLSIGLGVVA